MKRKEILVLIGEVLGSRAVYSVASLVITMTMLSGITIILRNDIRDIKNYVQSVVDGDPKYKEVHEQVSGSENVIRGNIDIEASLAKEDKKTEDANTSSNINSGYDNYTPTQTVTGESSNKPSNIANNSSVSGETSSGIASNNKPLNNDENVNTNDNTNNSNDSQKEEITDRSSFNGKDIMISEGEPFNPMNGLQLAATDINGKNITNKIVIKENNVDTYKPGLYTVKATVELSDKSNLEKEFFVRVEPTVLNLAVNDVRTSKYILEKNEEFNLSFAVKSSKSYLEVSSVNINNKDYSVKKTSSNSFFRTSNKYEVDLVAPSKGGTEKIEIKSVTMSDGTIVDINKSVNVEILKEEAQLTDASIKNISNENENIFLEYKLEDVDDTINKAFLYLYDENDIIIQQEELEKNNKSYINLNINENGKYKVQIKAYYKEDISIIPYSYNEKELFLENLEINKFNKDTFEQGYENEVDILSMNYDKVNVYSLGEVVTREKSNIVGSDQTNQYHDMKITGTVTDDSGEMPESTFKVTVPTTASFSVNQNGGFISPNLIVKNEGSQKVDIYVYSFKDNTNDGSINILSPEEFNLKVESTKVKRSDVKITLRGNLGEKVYLSSTRGNGVNSKEDFTGVDSEGNGFRVLQLEACADGVAKSGTISIDGTAGTGSTEAVSDTFILTLKIKKSE